KNRNTNFLKVGDFSIQLVQALAKSYLTDARYDSYFEAAPEYPLITYFTATLSSPSYTTTQKGFIKQLTTYFKQQFPTLTLANRKDIFSKKFTESIDLSYSYFKCLNSIPLDPADGITHYDLLLYVTRRDFLIAKRLQYNTSPTNACGVTTTSTTTKAPTTSTSTSTALPTTTVACTETAVCAHGFIPKKNCGKWSCYRDYANIPAEWRGYWGVTHVCEWTWPGSFAISIHCKEENDWTKANYFYFFIGLYIPEGLPWAPGLF
uniref:Uncharacterized protein n=1 Tax=Panagrolaimus sp. ES5 TaxID=591445 RepID=A0AC34GCC2_9BILA